MRRFLFLTLLLLLTVTWSMAQKEQAIEKEKALQEAFQPVDLSNFVNTPAVQNKAGKALLNEGFEGVTFPPDGWKVINQGDPNTWTRYTTSPITGAASASIAYHSTAHDDWLITPPLQITATNKTISFKAKNHHASYPDQFHVKLSTTGNNVADFTVTLASNVAPPTTATTYTYDLSAYEGQIVYIAIQAISTDQWRLYVDDFTGPEIYIPPTDLIITGLNKDYRLIPLSQLNSSLTLKTKVKNVGQALTDPVNAIVKVLDASNTELFTSTDAVTVPLATGAEVIVNAATAFAANSLGVGTYSFVHSVPYASDYNSTDNTNVFNFEVTEYLYARDAGTVAGGVGSNSGTITFGNKFEIVNDAILSGVQIQWPLALAAGDLTFGLSLYRVDGSNNVTSTFNLQGNFVRQQSMQGTTVTFPVRPVSITPGTYILAVKQLSSTNISMGFDGTSYGSFFIANNAANPTLFNVNQAFGNTTLRMDLTPKRIITFNVTDGTNPINGANITVKQGGVTVATGVTNNAGNAEIYAVNGAYTYTVTAIGYTTITDEPFTIAGDGTVNVTMTIAPPAAGITPSTWDYGTVHIDAQSTKVFNVQNVGNGVLTVAPTDITLAGDNADQFILTTLSDPVNLSMGQTAPFSVAFAPTSVGVKNAEIKVAGTTLATITGTAVDYTISTFPYAQSFDDATFPPLGWLNQKVAGAGNPGTWDRQTTGSFPTCSPIGTAMIRYNSYSYANGTIGILVTPRIDFDNTKQYAIVFKMYRDDSYTTNADKVEVLVNNQPYLTGAALLGTIHRNITLAPAVSANGWYDYQFNVPDSFYTAYTYVILKATSAYGSNIFVDEFAIKQYYTLSLESNPAGAGTLTGAGAYLQGTEVALNAAANAGYTFSHWSNAANDTLTVLAAFNYTMPANDVTLTANFNVGVQVVFNVSKSGSGDPIQGANIAINNLNLTTDATGFVEVYLPGGDFPYTVTKGGFESFTDTVIVGAVPQTINVSLNELPPMIGVTPVTWTFATTHVDMQSEAKEFTIKNIGGGVLTVAPGDVVLAGDDASEFVLTTFANTANLANNQTATFSVAFAPLSAGVKNAIVKISNDTVSTLTATAVDYTINTFPYAQSFDDVTFPPLGWVNQNLSGTATGVWQRVTTGGFPSCTPFGAAMLRFNSYNLSAGTSAMLVTSRIDFDDTKQYAVIFKMYRDNGYASSADKVEVFVNNQPNLTDAALLGTIHRSTTLAPAVSANGWYDYQFNVPDSFYTAYTYVILKATSAYGNNIFVDEFALKQYYTLTLAVNPVAAGAVSGGGSYLNGQSVAVSATANVGYAFENWTDATNAVVSTQAAFNYTMPEGDVTLTANFVSALAVTFNVKDHSNNAISGATVSVNGLTVVTNNAGQAVVYLAAGNYPYSVTATGYQNATGNVTVASDPVTVNVQMSDVISDPFALTVAVTGNNATLTWNNPPDNFVDGIESYDNFIIANIGPYTMIDVDGLQTYGVSGYTWPNVNYTGSFQVFNPSATTPPMTGAQWQPRTGSKYLACWNGQPASGVTANNDWLIFPQMLALNGMTFSFWARSATTQYGAERMRVLVSTTGTNPSDFIALTSNPYVEVPAAWTQYTYNLSSYAGMNIYVAIQVVSANAWLFMLDDVSITYAKNEPSKALLGYNVYLNGTQVATNVQDSSYTFTNLAPANYTAGVQAVYSSGVSSIVTTTFTVYPDDFAVTFNVVDNNGSPISGATVTVGSQTATTNATGVAVINLPNGVHNYTVNKLGYINVTGQVTVNYAAVSVNVVMNPASFNVTFVVTYNGNPVGSATVIINPGQSNQQIGLTNAQGTLIKPLLNGNYTYRVVKSGYNNYEGSFTVNNADMTVNVGLTGVSNVESDVRLYPNPVSNVLTIERNTTEDAVVEMFNTNGAVIRSFTTTDAVLTIDVNEVPAGTYFIRLIGNNSTTIHRFIKK